MEDSVWPSIITGGAGLVGVLIGSSITWLRDAWADRKQRTYLATRVICVLDKFVEDCASTVGQENEHPDLPVSLWPRTLDFPPDLDWRLLDGPLLYRILALPNRVIAAANAVDYIADVATTEHDPAHLATVNERYAPLGVEAFDLAAMLRRKYRLPDYQPIDDWRPLDILKVTVEKSIRHPPSNEK